jgi:ATP-dependent Clp protease ATP-binding subunit ClpA
MSIHADTSIQLVWAIANLEANLAGAKDIHPMHFFLGILKVIDPFFLTKLQKVDLTEEQKTALKKVSKDVRHYLEMSVAEVTQLRRSLRQGLRAGHSKPSEVQVLHRSAEARKVFEHATGTKGGKGQSVLTALELLKALFDTGQVPLELLKNPKKAKPDSKGARWEMIEDETQPTSGQFADWFGRNLTKLGTEGKLAPFYGRRKEIAVLIRTLTRTNRRNVAIVGAPGGGKTALVEGTALFLIDAKTPMPLRNTQILEMHGTDIASDCETETRLNRRLTRLFEVVGRMEKTVLFIDDLHGMFPPNLRPDATYALLATILGENDPPVIVTTTPEQWTQLKQSAPSLCRHFQAMELADPTPADCQGIADAWAIHIGKIQGTPFETEAIQLVLDTVTQLPSTHALPDKIVNLLENAATLVKVSFFSSHNGRRKVTANDIRAVLIETCTDHKESHEETPRG